jgi:hypothetical protein
MQHPFDLIHDQHFTCEIAFRMKSNFFIFYLTVTNIVNIVLARPIRTIMIEILHSIIGKWAGIPLYNFIYINIVWHNIFIN